MARMAVNSGVRAMAATPHCMGERAEEVYGTWSLLRQALEETGVPLKLYPGMEEGYERRHNELWPEMADMIHEYGGRNYSIFIDEETNILFGYIELEDPERYDTSAETEICRKWWDFMASVMETNADNSPVSVDLPCAFHLD